ncbi:MAG: hypothetical protein HGA31_05045 [Candidatus Moranbacteria bacterium]|nr:hypothetical protein [Candidatus Moranbacteria bacterium]
MKFRISGTVAIVIFAVPILSVGIFFSRGREWNFEARPEQSVDRENGNDGEASISGISTGIGTRAFHVAGWLPYWAKETGAASVRGRLGLFSEINPFAYGVIGDGILVDKTGIGQAPWPQLIADARQTDTAVIPTILWGDAAAMHKVFSDGTLLERHVDAIVSMLDVNGFSGVDIDYEGKDIADRDAFSTFLGRLHEKLSKKGKTLSCTVEARTRDDPPAGITGTRAMSFANDYVALDESCDSVRIMAYDQVFQIHRANTFTAAGSVPSAPNADSRWVEEVMRYALGYISSDKLIIGVSTYGWEFKIEKVPVGYRYVRVRSISYPDALEAARSAGAAPVRTDGGELSFTYRTADGEHIVTVDDGESVGQKIDIAGKLGLKGISLFKIDGLTDPDLFDILNGKRIEAVL